MCYSFRSSIIAYSIAIVTIFLMYMRQTKIDLYLMPFIFTYAFVQLAEAFMWYDKQCGIINKIGGYMVYINLILHILSIGVGIYLVEKKKHGLLLGGLFALYFLIKMPEIKCSKYKNNTMYWGFDSSFYTYIYILAVLLLMLSKMPIRYKIFLLVWYSSSWLYFFFKQVESFKKLITQKYDKNLMASLWCHISSFTVPVLYFIQYIF